jgi:plasmid stabilization system protein ParE
MTTVIFRPAAAADVEDAYLWYEGQRPGLGDEFLEAVESSIEFVQSHPQAWPVVHRDTRRALLHRFPHGLFYRLYEQQIVVVACMHASRDPRRWQSRTR